MLTRYRVQKEAGKELTIRIDPAKITGYVNGNVPGMDVLDNRLINSIPKVKILGQRLVYHLGPFAIPGSLYAKPVKLEVLKKYRKIKNLIENRADYPESEWYKEMVRELHQEGNVKHKEITLYSAEDLNLFFETYVLELVNSMERNGYLESKCSLVGNITIGRTGELHKSNAGDHRFMTASILGVNRMPFKIKGVHKEWLENQSIPNNRRGIQKLIRAIRDLEEENV